MLESDRHHIIIIILSIGILRNWKKGKQSCWASSKYVHSIFPFEKRREKGISRHKFKSIQLENLLEMRHLTHIRFSGNGWSVENSKRNTLCCCCCNASRKNTERHFFLPPSVIMLLTSILVLLNWWLPIKNNSRKHVVSKYEHTIAPLVVRFWRNALEYSSKYGKQE